VLSHCSCPSAVGSCFRACLRLSCCWLVCLLTACPSLVPTWLPPPLQREHHPRRLRIRVRGERLQWLGMLCCVLWIGMLCCVLGIGMLCTVDWNAVLCTVDWNAALCCELKCCAVYRELECCAVHRGLECCAVYRGLECCRALWIGMLPCTVDWNSVLCTGDSNAALCTALLLILSQALRPQSAPRRSLPGCRLSSGAKEQVYCVACCHKVQSLGTQCSE
jgi:hypothetical protein